MCFSKKAQTERPRDGLRTEEVERKVRSPRYLCKKPDEEEV
jgi:hypothetical protein